MDTVRIFDTTLRDGEQSPGATLTRVEKLEIARLLEAMGVDIIEAGFPISSNGDFESVRAIASEIGKSVVCGLARCTPGDIQRAGEAVQPAAMKRIHVFCATSKIHREHKLKMGREQIIKLSVESVRQARSYTDDVEFSPEDASRTELEFLEEIVHAVVEAGASTVNLPDTVGYATPTAYGRIFSHLLAKLPVIREKNVVLSCHCHDDLGLAVANSLAAIENGAPPGRMHRQRHRRARRQRGHGGDHHGPAHAPRLLQGNYSHRLGQDLFHQPHGQHPDRPGRAAQQGDRR